LEGLFTRQLIKLHLYEITLSAHNYILYLYDKPTNRKGKVKCTLVQALRLCTGRTAYRGSRSIALLFLDHGTRRG